MPNLYKRTDWSGLFEIVLLAIGAISFWVLGEHLTTWVALLIIVAFYAVVFVTYYLIKKEEILILVFLKNSSVSKKRIF